ncbi:Pleiotropic regulator 1 [Coelomomyces lativittatus]|nr:Pleiotropic regulator 1 [Coelomomyces lativittatus]
MSLESPPPPPIQELLTTSQQNTKVLFPDPPSSLEPFFPKAKKLKRSYLYSMEYAKVYAFQQRVPSLAENFSKETTSTSSKRKSMFDPDPDPDTLPDSSMASTLSLFPSNTSLTLQTTKNPQRALTKVAFNTPGVLALQNEIHKVPPPTWHAPWKLMRVISGHTGWVRSIAVDVSNEWFVTGAGDRLIKIWDLASGQLRLTLTGHISAVRGLAISSRHPYLFSAGEDKMIKCWDLEVNKVIRHYHGHLSGIYSLTLHPSLDVLATGGRDSTIRLWDMRSKNQIHVFTGHTSTIGTLLSQSSEYQLISGSHDTTIKCWDLRAGKCKVTLTHHKKSVRALALHPDEATFVSGSPDNIKKWVLFRDSSTTEFPAVKFVQNFPGHNSIVNCLAVNSENVFVSGGT